MTTKDYAMGIMLTFTKNEYKNDYTLKKIEKELINLYHNVQNSELNSFFFSCKADKEKIKFYSKYDFSMLNVQDNNDENFFRTMKNLLLEIKEHVIEDFERYIEQKVGFVFDFLYIFIFNFFKSYDIHISKYYENSYLRWYSFDGNRHYKLTIFYILQTIEKVKKILIKNTLKEEQIEHDIETIRKRYFQLEEGMTLHFIYKHNEIILYKTNGKIHYLKFTQKEMHHDLLPYIFNTKNYALLSNYIHFIDYKVISEIRPEYREKIIKFIEHSNERNHILLQNKICRDVIKHIINPMVNPDIKTMLKKN